MFDRTRTRRTPHLVTLIGDAGVGKSRIVANFERSLVDAATYVHGRCVQHGAGTTLWPLAQVLARQSGLRESDSPEVARSKIRDLVDRSVDRIAVSEAQAAKAFLEVL